MIDLARLLTAIETFDPSAPGAPTETEAVTASRYITRNALIMCALAAAAEDGMRTGIAFDPKEPDYPVVYIDLPTGQVSWHVPAYPGTWDGHSTAEKYERCRAFREAS